MAGHDLDFQVVYRGETFEHYRTRGWFFFQRLKECGGGYWLGRTYDGVFMIEYERPVSLNDGMDFLASMKKVEAKSEEFHPNYSLFKRRMHQVHEFAFIFDSSVSESAPAQARLGAPVAPALKAPP